MMGSNPRSKLYVFQITGLLVVWRRCIRRAVAHPPHAARHFGDPATEQHGKRRAGEIAQAGIERDLVEVSTSAPVSASRASMRPARKARERSYSKIMDAVGEQDQRAPHQRAHFVEKGEIGVAVRRQRLGAVMPRQEDQREQQQIADQKPVDRLAHHHRVLADINQEQQHQLAGEQHRRAGEATMPMRCRARNKPASTAK